MYACVSMSMCVCVWASACNERLTECAGLSLSVSRYLFYLSLIFVSVSLPPSLLMTIPPPTCLCISPFNTLQRMSSTEKKVKRHTLQLGKRKNRSQTPHIDAGECLRLKLKSSTCLRTEIKREICCSTCFQVKKKKKRHRCKSNLPNSHAQTLHPAATHIFKWNKRYSSVNTDTNTQRRTTRRQQTNSKNMIQKARHRPPIPLQRMSPTEIHVVLR